RMRVDPVFARRTDRARVVASARVVGRERLGYRFHAVWRAWKLAEVARQLAVDLLADPRRFVQQCVCRLRVESRIGAQELKKRRRAPTELRLADDRIHLAANPRDLGNADLMNGLRRGIGQRREISDQIVVVGTTVRKLGGADGVARSGTIFLLEESLECRVRG